MEIIPAIDLLNGKIATGPRHERIFFEKGPVDCARDWEGQGASLIQVIDVNKRREKEYTLSGEDNSALIREIAKVAPIMLGGGLKSRDDFIYAGEIARKVIVGGRIGVLDEDFFMEISGLLGRDRVVLALDYKNGTGFIRGEEPYDVFEKANKMGQHASAVLLSDINREGRRRGPNMELYRQAAKEITETEVIANGGASCLADVASIQETGIRAYVIGRALFDGVFSYRSAKNITGRLRAAED